HSLAGVVGKNMKILRRSDLLRIVECSFYHTEERKGSVTNPASLQMDTGVRTFHIAGDVNRSGRTQCFNLLIVRSRRLSWVDRRIERHNESTSARVGPKNQVA